ncbi:MAG: tyrosine-type recombinase/integrase [Phycisphaeraceae bacterium]|nr:tyrosine-type recombinase/integrase [Phycisphaeraceae bacterium]
MASLNKENGGWRVLVVMADGRKTIRLGKMDKDSAMRIKGFVESLASAKASGQALNATTATWLGDINDPLHERLAAAGLVAPRKGRATATLKVFMVEHLAGRADLKPATKLVREQVVNDLAGFFGEDRDVASITAGDADDFKQALVKRELAATTIHKRLQVARAFFHAMRRRKLIVENPFDGVTLAATGIRDRQRFVTLEEAALLLDACPNHDWRAIVALSRFGGLRCPSEVLSLRWQDIDWEKGRVVVTSPKTEHLGKDSRTIPLFPDLRRVLLEAFEAAPEGSVYVVDERYRQAATGPAGWRNANLRTTFRKIIRKAGLTPWERCFHNMRASLETELVEKYPVQVVTDWLGNTPKVAMRHYLMTTDAHFDAAVGSESLAQNPAQLAGVSRRKPAHAKNHETQNPAFSGALRAAAMACDASDNRPIVWSTPINVNSNPTT